MVMLLCEPGELNKPAPFMVSSPAHREIRFILKKNKAKIIIRRRNDLEKQLTIKNCDKTFLKNILRFLKNDDGSTLANVIIKSKNICK